MAVRISPITLMIMVKINTKSESGKHILDTLELTSDFCFTESHEKQYRQAIHKQLQVSKLKQIIDVTTTDRVKAYWKTFHCNRVKFQSGEKLIGSLCRKRWCQHCNRIKTAELVEAYKEPLQELQDKEQLYLVTLTAPTVQARELRSELTKRYKAFTRIKDNIRKNYNFKLVGIRKTEITYNEKKNWYHPHFHLIVQGNAQAELIRSLWFKQFPTAKKHAQDISEIIIEREDGKNGLVEVFKYATKDVTKDSTTAKAMDIIYRSLDGLRTIQTYGDIRKLPKPKERASDQTNIDWITPREEIWIYDEYTADYYDGELQPLLDTQRISKEIINKAYLINNGFFNEHEIGENPTL